MNKTEQLKRNKCPLRNQYQGDSLRILFVCAVGMLRSPTAAHFFAEKGFNTRCCGANLEYALIPISENLVIWGDVIVCMARDNLEGALKIFPDYKEEIKAKTIVARIDDDFNYKQKELIIEIEDFFFKNGPKIHDIAAKTKLLYKNE
jgi:predicted protein tyrosine phosphatase